MRNLQRTALILIALTLGVPAASAHAWLLDGEPGPNEHVDAPPSRVVVQFTENVEHDYTRLEVYDVNGTRVDDRNVVFSDERGNEISVGLNNIGDGVYTVRWYTLSVDTHTAQGTYVFAAGNASLAGAPPASSAHEHGASAVPMWLEAVARWMHYIGGAAAVGLPLFVLFVARNPLPQNLRRLHQVLVALGGIGVLGAALVLFAFSQRIETTVSALATASFGTVGNLLTLRVAFQLVLLVCAAIAFATLQRPHTLRILQWAIVVTGGLILLTTSLSSHAASVAEDRANAVGGDFLHLAAGSVWIGGVLAFLLLAKNESRERLSAWISRFSPLAILCVFFVVLSGAFASFLHLTHPLDLFRSTYGWMIVCKVLLLIPLISLGAFNRYVARRNLRQDGGWDGRPLRRALVAETTLMALVLLAAGVLATSAPPSGVEGSGEEEATVEFQRSLTEAHLVLAIGPAPLSVGLHNYTVEVHAFDGENPPGSEVFLQFAPPGRGKSDEIHRMTRISSERWGLDGGFLTERGEWTVYVTVQADEYEVSDFKVVVN